jgi:hypothetical protein
MPLRTLLINHKVLSLIPRPKASAIRFRSKETKRIHSFVISSVSALLQKDENEKLTYFP